MINLSKLIIKIIVLIVLIEFIVPFPKNISAQELIRYTCLVDRINISKFESSYTFDNKGIIKLKNGKYHPLTIAQYGVLAYYQYIDSMDSTFFRRCINQVNYFKDSTRVNSLFNGKGIGLPYNFNFKDLKAPWYSGMTQGYALSYLLRYYTLTKDKTILPIIKKIAFVLISPQETGGTISTSKDGCYWIEEYPNSKKSRQVLNGFINALIGLYEYCQFFKEDLIALQIFNETYDCLKKNLEYYDTPTWSFYNRNNVPITNKYLWYQIYEMRHLYELFKEPLFDSQMRIWTVILSDKLTREKKTQEKQFVNKYYSMQVERMNDSLYHIPLNAKQKLATDSLQTFNLKSTREYRRYSKRKKQKKSKKHSRISFINFSPTPSKLADYAEITFNDSTLYWYYIKVYKKSGMQRDKLVELAADKYLDKNRLLLSFPESNISDIVIKMEKKSSFDITTNEVKFFNISLSKNPFFAHHISQPFNLEKGIPYRVNLPLANTKNAVLFYKFAPHNKNLSNSKWKAVNTVDLNIIFTPANSGLYKFMAVFNWNGPLSFIGNINIFPLENRDIILGTTE